MIRDGRLIQFRQQAVRRYIANSWYSCELLDEIIPCALERCSVLHNRLGEAEIVAPLVSLPERVEARRVMMVGNIRKALKGYDTALAAAAICKERGLPVECHIAGRGDDLAQFETIRKSYGLESTVHYAREVANPDSFIRRCNVFLLTSRVEGMSNALLEAMNLGFPRISTRVGDVARFATDPRHLRIVPNNAPTAIADALTSFLTNWPEACAMGGRARVSPLYGNSAEASWRPVTSNQRSDLES